MKKQIAIVMGGYSSEHDISLKSAQVVHNHLDKEKFDLYKVHIYRPRQKENENGGFLEDKWVYENADGIEVPIDKSDFSLSLGEKKITFDCVFNAIHGTPGEDGLLQAYFELLGIPQTSCAHYQAALTFNKRDLLSTLKPFGVLSATSHYLDFGSPFDEESILKKVGLPCFVKANRAGSSYGISKVYQKSEVKDAIHHAFKEDSQILIESFLDGTEVSVGVITFQGEAKVLPITEIVPENDFFDYEAKYLGKSQEITPARISKAQEEKVSELALSIYKILGLKGYSRSEFIFVENVPYLLEVNTTPGLTEESILPQQALVAGISLSELFESAIDEALR
ncbi:MAG: D-alanine--D-alanine ligase [Bacteroidota bacterium]